MTTPNDPLYNRQWHFDLIGNIEAIWTDYTGVGVHVGVYDDGLERTHEDIAANYDASLHFRYLGVTYDPFPLSGSDDHGTACAGLIGAVGNNGRGGVGVAWGVSLTGVNLLVDLQNGDRARELAAFSWAANFDIMSNSWSWGSDYSAQVTLANASSPVAEEAAKYAQISAVGRGGLGTIVVQAAGNDAANANAEGTHASRHTISVSATEADGRVADYSNFGACILLAGPASAVTTDRSGNAGANTTTDAIALDPDYRNDFNGTSAATPTVSGVIALMLDANEGLGWRDVHNILALSAGQTGSDFGGAGSGFETGRWFSNGGSGWNGGGQLFHLSYGYGMVDAYAAVRMAEVWSLMRPTPATSSNEVVASQGYTGANVAIPDATGTTPGVARVRVTETQHLEIEAVYVTVAVTHSYAEDLTLSLVAPDGTVVSLMAREGGATLMDGGFRWVFGVEALRGHDSAGQWTLLARDMAGQDTGTITDFSLRFFGAAVSANDIHSFTDDFLAAASVEASRRHLADANGGVDWLNFAAVTGAVRAGLAAGANVSVRGVHWATVQTASFENIVTGDGADVLTGNGAANTIRSMRGNDTLAGAAGTDRLFGGAGADSLNGGSGADAMTGGTGADRFVFASALGGGNVDRVTDFNTAADLILLDNAVFTRLAVGTLAAGAFRASAAGVATQADDRIIYDTDSGALWYDTNGSASGGAMRFATLDTGLALQAADFRIF